MTATSTRRSVNAARHTNDTPIPEGSGVGDSLQIDESRCRREAQFRQGGAGPRQDRDGRSAAALREAVVGHCEEPLLLVRRQVDCPLQEAARLIELVVSRGVARA